MTRIAGGSERSKLSKSIAVKAVEERLEALITLGREDPIAWVELCFGATLSNQQKEFFEAVVKLEKVKMLEHAGLKIPAELQPYAGKIGISIRSGNGTGKDCVMAWHIIRQLTCFPSPGGLVTAPRMKQVQNIVHREVDTWLNKRDDKGEFICPLRELVRVQTNKIMFVPGGGKGSYIEPVTTSLTDTPEEQAETLAGRHAEYLTIYVTEASGVLDPVFKPLERTLTGLCNYAILIWNPTRTSGFAYNSHYSDKRSSWVVLHWDAEKSDRVSKAHIEGMAKRHGRDSNMFRVAVKGIPPVTEDGMLIPFESVYAALEREFDVPADYPCKEGLDVGRQGDKSAIVKKHGPRVSVRRSFRKDDLTEVAADALIEYSETEPDGMFIDVNGMGWGVFDIAKKRITTGLFAVNVTMQPRSPEKFYQLRDELYWLMREDFISGKIALDPGEHTDELMSELTSLKYDMVRKQGQDRDVIKVWGKKEMKRRGFPSPNLADALALTYYRDDTFFFHQQGRAPAEDPWLAKFRKAREKKYDTGWLGA